MELLKTLPGIIELSSSVGEDVWRERYKELQDWIETMSGALPKLAPTDKNERSLCAGWHDPYDTPLYNTSIGMFETLLDRYGVSEISCQPVFRQAS